MNNFYQFFLPFIRKLALPLSLATGALVVCGSSQAQTLVWQENFDAPALNTKAWSYDFGNGSQRAAGYGWGNNELEYYTSRPENVRTDNGNLILEARKENFDGSGFTSGRIKTEGRVHFKYGTVEARIKIPNLAKGLWPAFWTLGTIGPSWPGIGEIDIMEIGSKEAIAANKVNNRVSSAAHWSNADGGHEFNVSYTDVAQNLSDDYHLFKMVWTSQAIKMYVDGLEYYSFDISGGAAANLSEFHTPHFLLLNLAVGGQYTGIFDAAGITAALPAKMYVDYVKLYQNPGDELYLANEHAPDGNFGILTETTPVTDSLSYGKNANLYYWNNLTNIVPAPTAFEGNSLLAVHANAGDWFGMGIDNNYVNLSNFAAGSLKFQFKSTYGGQYKVGLKTGHGETWINFAAGEQKYGLVRDGNWHQVTIPLADFNNGAIGNNIDLYSLKAAFMFAGDPAANATDFYFDDMYFSGGLSPNPAPTVAITAPGNNAIFTAPASITIEADAADANGSVAKVDFYSGSTLLGSDNTAPYSFTWNNALQGVDTITVKAIDNEGSVTTSAPVIVFVANAGNTAPEIAISSPASNASFLTPINIAITASATDVDGGVYKVDFYKDGSLIGTSTTSPYTYNWVNAPAGSFTLTAKATDIGGLSTTSAAVNIMVADPIKPTVSITSPTNNSYFTPPANITIEAGAADANGSIVKVEFLSGSTVLGMDDTAPYSFVWANVPVGSYTVTAKATDNDGNTTTSAPVQLGVEPVACKGTAANGDYAYEVYTEAGTVYFKFKPLAPIAGSNLAIINIKEGSGGFGGYGMTAAGADFTFSKPIADAAVLSFYFTYNTPPAGENNSSANPHSYVVGTVCVPGAPTVAITAPAEGASFTAPANITIAATAADSDGTIAKVEFLSGSTVLGMDDTSPYTFAWNGVAAGSYVLTAKATDNSGLVTTSLPINIAVNTPNANGYCGTAISGDYEYKAETANGIVTFTMHPLAPIAGSAYALIYVREGLNGGYPGYPTTASGTDFIFTKAIADGTPVSFYYTYQTPPAGERNSAANPHSYTVGNNCTGSTGTPPSVSITAPANNASFTAPAAITIAASATDADGTIAKLEFYSGATLLGMDDSSPYSFDWANVPAGNYIITVKATDNSGFSTISQALNVVVNLNNAAGFCGTVENGDYSYKVETVGENVVFQFHPLTPIEGSNFVLIYVREGLSGGYPGYQMTKVGTDFTFSKAIPAGTPISVYFTYNVPSGGERNSAATPHSYTVGTVCDGLLPVTLLDYTASLQTNGTVFINWQTAAEQHSQYFLVEKSTDGVSFAAFAKIGASTATGNTHLYQAVDKTPGAGIVYYRLIQVDKDGRTTVYSVKTLKISIATKILHVQPNPLNGTLLNVQLPAGNAQLKQVRLYDMAGKVIYQGAYLPQANLFQVKLPVKPASGMYQLAIEGYNSVKLVVQ